MDAARLYLSNDISYSSLALPRAELWSVKSVKKYCYKLGSNPGPPSRSPALYLGAAEAYSEEDSLPPDIETEGLLLLESCLSVVMATEPSRSEVIGVTIKLVM